MKLSFLIKVVVAGFIFQLINSCSPSLKKPFEKNEVFKNSFSGLMIYDSEAREIIYEKNAHKYFTPASNIKLLTYFAGLKYLEDSIPGLKYKVVGDTLYFTTTADPSFLNPYFSNNSSLDFLKKSDKELAYIKSNWEEEAFGSGWAWDDFNYAFSAEKSAFPVYGNLIQIGKDKIVTVFPKFFTDSLFPTKEEISVERDQFRNIFTYSTQAQFFSRKIPFLTSEELSVQLIRDTLKRDIQIKDHIALKAMQVHNSIPADSLYKEMLQKSDNFIAEQILLMISQKISDTLKTNIAIERVTNEYFKDLPEPVFWVDGSGLSRYNLITPADLVEILKKIESEAGQDKIMALFPAGGNSGTLKNMFKDQETFVFAKSGSLRHIYNLSGYLLTKKGKWFIFSFMNMNSTATSEELKSAMEKVLLKVRNKY